jgi:hypothetical protein
VTGGSDGTGAVLALGYGAGGPAAPIYLAHHALVIALPFVVPVLLVVAMVAVVAWRDRHRPADVDDLDAELLAEDADGSGTAQVSDEKGGART